MKRSIKRLPKRTQEELAVLQELILHQIAEELAKLGHNIDRKIIVVKDAVKEVGNYKAIVKLHKEVSVEIPFEVVAEEA